MDGHVREEWHVDECDWCDAVGLATPVSDMIDPADARSTPLDLAFSRRGAPREALADLRDEGAFMDSAHAESDCTDLAPRLPPAGATAEVDIAWE